MNEYSKNIPEETPGLAIPEIRPTDEHVPIEIINGVLKEIKRQEREENNGEEKKKPTLH